MIDDSVKRTSTRRICPCYRLPQLTPGQTLNPATRLPLCTAVDPPERLAPETAVSLCRSGAFQTCPWFQEAMPNWKPESIPVRPHTGSSHQSAGVAEADEQSLGWQILSSAAWVIGIPTGITLLIIIAIWFTENVWMPTHHILGTIFV